MKKDFDRLRELIDDRLNQLLPPEDLEPRKTHEAMRYSVFAGGKRLRPIIALLYGEAINYRASGLLDFACAIEIIHAYSLIHDDLPAMDNDGLRRGKPTNHIVFGEAGAILAGVGLLVEAFRVASKATEGTDPSGLANAISLLADAAGPCGMAGGQAIDLESEGEKWTDSETRLPALHRAKTGRMISVSAAAAPLLAGLNNDSVKLAWDFGMRIGLAFQIIDDILDCTGKTEKLGKPTGSDDERAKLTFVSLYGVEECRAKALNEIEQAKAALLDAGASDSSLYELADFIVERDH